MPTFIDGTAWKTEPTARLVSEALGAGFVAIDTAAQQKYYREDLVGEANPLLDSEPTRLAAEELGIRKETALYCLVLALDNVVVLNGTTSAICRSLIDAVLGLQQQKMGTCGANSLSSSDI
ncbi:hypothetical protein MMC27_004100 [Xylographa pallens]|nr:hypothetical protein [Xylographa pallens]